MNTTRLLLQVGFACAIGTFLPAASCDGGDVNRYGCPEAETCSPKTEDGLHFVGPRIGEGILDFGEVKTLAQGGTEHVQLEIGDGEKRRPFQLRFDAELAGPAHVESRAGNTLVLRGDDGGPDFLRIVDPGDDDALFDRVLVDSAPLATIGLTRSFGDWVTGTPSDADMLFAPGGTAIVALAASDGRALVDESMRLAGAGAQVAWDQVQIGNLSPGKHTLTATAAGRTAELAFDVVAGPDRLVRLFGADTLEQGSAELVCYGAMLGSRYVHVAWSIEVTNAKVEPSTLVGCVFFTATATGAIQIHATGGSLSVDESIAVTPSKRARPVTREQAIAAAMRGLAPRITVGDDLGERAALSQQLD